MKLYLFDDIDSFDYRLHFNKLPDWRREKALRYRQELDRKLCVASYLLLCEALKDGYGVCGPVKLAFNEHGKPYLADFPQIFFNLSHCCCGVACAVSDYEVGADVQDVRPYSADVARRVFCKAELKLLNSSFDKEREFARLWSRKEAYLKMLGTGISDDMKSVDTNALDSLTDFEFDSFFVSVCGDKHIDFYKISFEG